MAEINFKNLISTGAHFGHVTRKWHPEYAPYILMEKNGIHIINLDETIQKLNKALAFTSEMAQKNGEFLFVGTKKQARDIIQQEADRCGMFYVVERWYTYKFFNDQEKYKTPAAAGKRRVKNL